MTVKEIETLIPVALERFKQRIPQFVEWIDNVPIRVATRHTGEKTVSLHNKITESVGKGRSKKHNAQTGTLRLGTLQGRKVARIFEGLGFATLKARPCPMNRVGQPVLLTGII